MTDHTLFSNYLHDLMNTRSMSVERLQTDLGYASAGTIRGWLNGWSVPPLGQLTALTEVLDADQVETHVGWLIDQCPELEALFRIEVLNTRDSKYPRSGDLTLRPCLPRPSLSLCED
jgi:hypothetical protein